MTDTIKKIINDLTDDEIKKACFILDLLETVCYSKIDDFDKRRRYIDKIQVVRCDVSHIKEFI